MSAVTIRPATPTDASVIAQVRVDAWRTTYRGLIPDGYLAAMRVEDSTALWTKVLTAAPNTTNTFVAEIDGAVVGFASASCWRNPSMASTRNSRPSISPAKHSAPASGASSWPQLRGAARTPAQPASSWVIAGNKAAAPFTNASGRNC